MSEKFGQISLFLLLRVNSSCSVVSDFDPNASDLPLHHCDPALSPDNPTVRKIGIPPRRNPRAAQNKEIPRSRCPSSAAVNHDQEKGDGESRSSIQNFSCIS